MTVETMAREKQQSYIADSNEVGPDLYTVRGRVYGDRIRIRTMKTSSHNGPVNLSFHGRECGVSKSSSSRQPAAIVRCTVLMKYDPTRVRWESHIGSARLDMDCLMGTLWGGMAGSLHGPYTNPIAIDPTSHGIEVRTNFV